MEQMEHRLDSILQVQDELNETWQRDTPILSHDQDLKKDRNKRSMYSEPLRPTDTGKYCQNLKTWGKTDFLPKKWVKKTWKWAKNVLVWYGMVWYG